MKIALSMPYLFNDIFYPDSIKGELESSFLEKHLKTGRKLKSPVKGIELYVTKEGKHSVFFGVQGGTVVYYMKTDKRPLTWVLDHPLKRFNRSVYQAEVWRHNKLQWPENTITTQVFATYLVSKARLVVSDKLQSESGRTFWVKQITQALSMGYKAWVMVVNEKGETLEVKAVSPVIHSQQVDQYYTTGSDYAGTRLRLAITG